MVHFVGAGPGAPDLITRRGAALLQKADCIIYAGSLVNPALLGLAKADCAIYNSAEMTLEQVLDVMRQMEAAGKITVRLHTGDPCLYGAIREQMDVLDAEGIPYDDTPGVSSFCGAAAALNAEYTLPTVSQTVIITRMEGRTPVPEKEKLASLAAHGATMVIFLSIGLVDKVQQALLAGGAYTPDTPAAVVYKAHGRKKNGSLHLGTLAESVHAAGITKTALIVQAAFWAGIMSAASSTTRPLPPSSARGQTSDPRLSGLYGKGLALAQNWRRHIPAAWPAAAMKPAGAPCRLDGPPVCRERCPCFCRCCGHCGAGHCAPLPKQGTGPCRCGAGRVRPLCRAHPLRPPGRCQRPCPGACRCVRCGAGDHHSHRRKRCVCGGRVGKAPELHRAGAGAHQACQRCTAGGQNGAVLHPTGPLRVHRLMGSRREMTRTLPSPSARRGMRCIWCRASACWAWAANAAPAPKRWPKPLQLSVPRTALRRNASRGGKHRLKTKRDGPADLL